MIIDVQAVEHNSYDNDNSLDFTWDAASGEVDHYNVYVSTNGNDYVLDGTTSENSYTVTGSDGHDYKVKVEAVDAVGNIGPMSLESDLVNCDTCPPESVNDLQAKISSNDILFEWTASQGAVSYNIYRDKEPDFVPDLTGGSNQITKNISDEDTETAKIEWTDSVDDINSSYFYAITAVDAAGNESKISNKAGIESINCLSIVSTSNTTVQLNITDATGITGGDIFLEYDSDLLTVEEVRNTQLTSEMNLFVDKQVPGKIIISLAGTDTIPSGSGALVEMLMTTSQDTDEIENLFKLSSDTKIYDNSGSVIPINLKNKARVMRKGDINGDGEILSNDAILALQISVGEITPTSSQKYVADMNDDGIIESNDAILILENTEISAPSIHSVVAFNNTVTVMMEEVHGISNESVTVPIKVNSIRGIAGGDICINYDSSVLRAVDVISNSSLLLEGRTTEPGIVKIAFANTSRLNNQKLAEVKFDIIADDVSNLTFKSAKFYQSNAVLVNSNQIDGYFSSWAIPPEHSLLMQNYPNPFNPETWIPYQLKKGNEVKINIYNLSGQLLRELNLGYKSAGVYISRDRAAYWDGRNKFGIPVASGVYFYKIKAGNFNAIRKLVVLK